MALEHMLPIQEKDISLLELLGIGTSPRERKTPRASVAAAELYTSTQPPGPPVWFVSISKVLAYVRGVLNSLHLFLHTVWTGGTSSDWPVLIGLATMKV